MANNLQQSIADKFQFVINNNVLEDGDLLSVTAKKIAISAGNIPTGQPGSRSTSYLEMCGYPVTAVLDDRSTPFAPAGSGTDKISMYSVDPTRPICHAIADLKLNPRYIKKVTIASNTEQAFYQSMSIASLSPFHTEALRDIDLSQYFSVLQYQNSKIDINYQPGEFQFNDSLFWSINIPAGCQLTITVEFYNE